VKSSCSGFRRVLFVKNSAAAGRGKFHVYPGLSEQDALSRRCEDDSLCSQTDLKGVDGRQYLFEGEAGCVEDLESAVDGCLGDLCLQCRMQFEKMVQKREVMVE